MNDNMEEKHLNRRLCKPFEESNELKENGNPFVSLRFMSRLFEVSSQCLITLGALKAKWLSLTEETCCCCCAVETSCGWVEPQAIWMLSTSVVTLLKKISDSFRPQFVSLQKHTEEKIMHAEPLFAWSVHTIIPFVIIVYFYFVAVLFVPIHSQPQLWIE